jgi:hypothetical protein
MVRLPPDQRGLLTNVRRKIEQGRGVVSAACSGLLEGATRRRTRMMRLLTTANDWQKTSVSYIG